MLNCADVILYYDTPGLDSVGENLNDYSWLQGTGFLLVALASLAYSATSCISCASEDQYNMRISGPEPPCASGHHPPLLNGTQRTPVEIDRQPSLFTIPSSEEVRYLCAEGVWCLFMFAFMNEAA